MSGAQAFLLGLFCLPALIVACLAIWGWSQLLPLLWRDLTHCCDGECKR